MVIPVVTRDSSEPRAFRPVPAIHNATTSAQFDGTPVSALQVVDSNIPNLKPEPVARNQQFDLTGSESRIRDGARFLRDPAVSAAHSRSSSQSPFRISMPTITPGQLAFSALQYLPVPTIVLNNLKTVVLANEAMGRMLGLVSEDTDEHNASTTLERLRGQTLSQVGVDMLQDGRPVWITWDAFLDNLVGEMGVRAPATNNLESSLPGGEATPTVSTVPPIQVDRKPGGRPRSDAVVEVVISRKDINKTAYDSRYKSRESDYQAFAKMIISIWEIDDKQTYFTLTFTSTQSSSSPLVPTKKSIARQSLLEAAERRSISHSNPPSVASSRDSNSPAILSPGSISLSSSPFPPMGPPSAASMSSTPSLLQKMIRMKDALLDNTQMPILAMWKDGSVMFPNKACRLMFQKDADFDSSTDGFELLQNWELWTEDFTQRLDVSQYPITILLKTEQPFSSIRVGMYDEDGKKKIFDVLGEDIRDEATGEFLAAVVTGRDVTDMTNEITKIKERDEERFKLICDTMPQFVWTATPDGMHDFFNTRWYTYTGLTPEECLGAGWKLPFHPEDLQECVPRWKHSLATGDPYVTEYRCRSKDGEWRWFLGRALAVRNKKTGEIEKWFGTCTDVHESIQTKMSAKRTRQQLLSVIAHAHVTIFATDINRRVTMLEGALIWDSTSEESHEDGRWFIGENVYTVFNRLTEQLAEGERPDFLNPIEDILDGRVAEDGVDEHQINNRWYRTRFLPMHGKQAHKDNTGKASCVDGVIGVIMDVTELRAQKAEATQRLEDKHKAEHKEQAAQEATRLKSQFLANMSHEIRTPITGVLGMAELLSGMELDEEQQECVENIQSSATSLLTVINDILDFSKVESGRLDIEEVQFSLSHIVQEVVRMLRFAVERKSLDFQSDISGDIQSDMVVLGDPGRVRQIITNLLTNSIKFTSQGYVRFSVSMENETADSVEIKFVVEDTGIGIQEDVRKKLFQPFSQGDASTARRFGGTGLGLTICKNLLDLMHGRISLDSRPGNGTVATFWIPFHKSHGQKGSADLAHAGAIPDRLQSELSLSCTSSEYEQGTSSPVSEGVGGFPRRRHSTKNSINLKRDIPEAERAKIHILVVEDNAINQKIAIKVIAKLGFQVTAAWNGKEALEYLVGSSEGENPKPDMILMDVQMPIIDGYKCTHLLRHHLPYKSMVQDVPIVAMTASAIQGDREKCTKAGMDDYLAKPVTMKELERMVVRWLLSRRKAHPAPHPTASDCSEASDYCETADIPQIGLDEPESFRSNANSPITPRPLTTNGRHEPSPFDYSVGQELKPQVRKPEGETEWSNKLQETKLIDAAGIPTSIRNHFQEQTAGDSLTEENMNRLKHENQQ